MLDEALVEERIKILCDRFTAAELVELLNITTYDICDQFRDACLELKKEDIYD